MQVAADAEGERRTGDAEDGGRAVEPDRATIGERVEEPDGEHGRAPERRRRATSTTDETPPVLAETEIVNIQK